MTRSLFVVLVTIVAFSAPACAEDAAEVRNAWLGCLKYSIGMQREGYEPITDDQVQTAFGDCAKEETAYTDAAIAAGVNPDNHDIVNAELLKFFSAPPADEPAAGHHKH